MDKQSDRLPCAPVPEPAGSALLELIFANDVVHQRNVAGATVRLRRGRSDCNLLYARRKKGAEWITPNSVVKK